jgi:hypothetical protein
MTQRDADRCGTAVRLIADRDAGRVEGKRLGFVAFDPVAQHHPFE